MRARKSAQQAFSLLELLIVLLVLGVILFLAFPNIVQVKSDSERELAKARAEALNMAAAAYFQAQGTNAVADWADTTTEQDRYDLIKDYIAFPATNLASFLPSSDYTIEFDDNDPHKRKATLYGPGTNEIAY
jgi:prepilin-type N-terminal cleavage/methylation domain-containing protein